MAHSECHILTSANLDKYKENNKCSLSEAIRVMSGDSDIPESTIKKWYYGVKNEGKSKKKKEVFELGGQLIASPDDLPEDAVDFYVCFGSLAVGIQQLMEHKGLELEAAVDKMYGLRKTECKLPPTKVGMAILLSKKESIFNMGMRHMQRLEKKWKEKGDDTKDPDCFIDN